MRSSPTSELGLEANPDWGGDTGVMIRATGIGSQGFQVLVDHRQGGNIGSFYGNGIGGFNTRQFGFKAEEGLDGQSRWHDAGCLPRPKSSTRPGQERGGLVGWARSILRDLAFR